MAGKYTPLEKYLAGLPESTAEITLTFVQIETILAGKLPASAYEDRRWWDHATEGNHRSTRSWANAGWRVESLDVNARWVKFVPVRQGFDAAPGPWGESPAQDMKALLAGSTRRNRCK